MSSIILSKLTVAVRIAVGVMAIPQNQPMTSFLAITRIFGFRLYVFKRGSDTSI